MLERETNVAKKLYPSLHGFYRMLYPSGIVQLLPNLYKQGFRPLCPEALLREAGMSWTKLWDAFGHFALDTLVTLASTQIVHPDIRPGCDETANLLYDKKEIRMVDLDSLCTFIGWEETARRLKSPQYINVYDLDRRVRRALAFVYLQVILVAEVWLAQVRNEDVRTKELLENSGKLPESGSALTVDCELVKSLVREYRQKFEKKDRTAMPPPSLTTAKHPPEASKAASLT
jgi:hypothetical protein